MTKEVESTGDTLEAHVPVFRHGLLCCVDVFSTPDSLSQSTVLYLDFALGDLGYLRPVQSVRLVSGPIASHPIGKTQTKKVGTLRRQRKWRAQMIH